MSPQPDAEDGAQLPSRVPRILGLIALGVLALAFTGAMLGSLRNHRWDEAEDKGEIARRELARLETVVERARELLAERLRLRARMPEAPESSLRVTQLRNLVELEADRHRPPLPDRSRVPTSEELEALDLWLESLYRRVAARQDIESRLPDLEEELGRLRRSTASDPLTCARERGGARASRL